MKATPMRIEEFGSELLRSLDLDPVYVMLVRAKLPAPTLAKWLLAYWCYYHCGVASLLSEESTNVGFWTRMHQAAINDRNLKVWPRSAERRHFRGAQAIRGVEGLENRFFDPERMIESVSARRTFNDLNRHVQTWPQFGPWIAFKVCDMVNCLIHPIDFATASLAVYAEPAKGAALAYEAWNPGELPHKPQFYVDYAVERLRLKFAGVLAPPHFDRPVGIMEIETVLCKWKSHVNGHYPIGKDTHEIREGLKGWGDTAQHLQQFLPEPPC